MKVFCILGSPKKQGNTAKVLSWIEEEFMAKGHEVDHIHITDYEVQGCIGCYQCQQYPDRPGCVLEDDGNALFERIISSDVILHACPLYCWGIPSQLKALMDRGICLVTGYGGPEHRSLVDGKGIGLLITAGGPIENNADLVPPVYERGTEFLKTRYLGSLIIPFCTTPDALGEDVEEKAIAFAHQLTRSP